MENGKYSVRVAAGPCKVVVSAKKLDAKLKDKGSIMKGELGGEEMLPAKYNDRSELSFDVASGKNEKNWELKTK